MEKIKCDKCDENQLNSKTNKSPSIKHILKHHMILQFKKPTKFRALTLIYVNSYTL